MKPPGVIRDRAAAMTAHDLEGREVLINVRVDQAVDRHRLVEQEIQSVRRAGGARAGRMDVGRNVELAKLLVEWIPVAVAHRRGLGARVLIRIGVEQAALETKSFNAALQ